MTKLLNEKKIINFKVDQMISWSLPEHLNDYLFWEKILLMLKIDFNSLLNKFDCFLFDQWGVIHDGKKNLVL